MPVDTYTEAKDVQKAKDGEITVTKALKDFQRAYQHKKKILDVMEQDFEFALGKQWEDEDVKTLEDAGVRALTFNKIWPNINLMLGLESQNRSDMKAFPEGEEDSVTAEIATALLKNVMKTSEGDFKVSEVFDDGITCGEGYLEPYLDFTESLLNGEMRFKKADYYKCFPDPTAQEYDLWDGSYFCKITYDLSREQLLQLYPDKEALIDKVKTGGKIVLDRVGGPLDGLGVHLQQTDYHNQVKSPDSLASDEPTYDLLEYYHKMYVDKYLVADLKLGTLKEANSKQEAESYVATATQGDAAGQESARVIRKRVPEVWCMSIIGNLDEALWHGRAWSYPKWKRWPFIPYYAYKKNTRLKDNVREYSVQGITRQMKDPNREYNKRRTQELRHLNQSANSGWLTPKGAWVDEDKVEEFGSSPGINLEYDPARGKPERISPTPLSQGHAQIAAENNKDMKESSGINPDMLALQEGGTDSGRAIALRQKQGLVMVQKIFDNLSRTKKMLGKFILSQLSDVFDVDTAIRVLGDAFIQENFSQPVMQPVVDPKTGQPAVDPSTGQPIQGPVVDPMTGQPAMQVNKQAVVMTFNQVLNDAEIGKYDIAIGENISSETMQYANFMTLTDLAQKGVPIPPDVLVDESMISNSAKEKIKASMSRMAAAAQGAPAKK